MIKQLFTLLFFSIANIIFAENESGTILNDKAILDLQKYCEKHPDLWQGFYNLGREYYQQADFKNAEGNFSAALQKCSEPNLQESIFYNLGNTYFKQFQEAEKEQQIPLLEKSIQNYESALALNQDAEDTKKNLEIAKKLLEKLKDQQKQQQQNQDKKRDQQQDKDKKDDQNKQQNNNNNQQQETKNDKQDSSNQNNQQQKQQDNSQTGDQKDQKGNQQNAQPEQNNEQNQQKKQQQTQSSSQPSGPKDMKKQEMENILQKEKNNERILPINFSKNQKSSQDKILKDW